MLPKFWLSRLQQLSFFDTFKHASTYFSGTLVVHVLGVISLPVFTAYLGTDEYGVVNVFTSYIPILAASLSFYLYGAAGRYYFEEGRTDFKEFMGTLWLAITGLFLVLGSVWWLLMPILAVWMNLPVHLLKWLLAMSYLTVIMLLFGQVMISAEKSKHYSTVQVVWQYGKFGLSVILMACLVGAMYQTGDGWESYTYMGKIIGEFWWTLLMALYACWAIRKYVSFRQPSWSHLRYAVDYSLPLLPMALSGYLLTSFDQWYIISAVGREEAGLYAFAYKIGLLYMGLIMALLNGANYTYYTQMNAGETDKINQQVDSVVKLLVWGACFLIFFAVDVGTLLSADPDFLGALPIAPVIVAGYVFHGIALFINRGIYYIKRNSYLAVLVVVTCVINVLLNIHYIPTHGFKVAAYTTLVSYAIMMVLSFFVTTYLLKLPPPPIGRILKYLVFLAIVIAINYLLGAPNVGLHLGWMCFKGGLFVLLGAVLFFNKITLFLSRGDTP